VREIARFHGSILRQKEELGIAEQLWLKKIAISGTILGFMFGGFYQRFYSQDSNSMTEEDWEIARRFLFAFDEWQDEQMKSVSENGKKRVMGLNHYDFRMDNILFRKEEKVTIVDWQTLQHGPVVSDFAYFLAGSLKTEDRRPWMEELVEVYVDGVGKNDDGNVLNREDVMNGLRERVWAGVIGSIVGAMIGERNERGDVMLAEMMRRSCVMARDLRAVNDLPQSGACGEVGMRSLNIETNCCELRSEMHSPSSAQTHT
jgi:hypothetical protein